MTRETWKTHRQTFSQNLRDRALENRDRSNHWNLLTGLPRASMLHLGYSVEMYLKAGLAKAYRGCSEQMFQRDIKERFSHKLVSLANEIAFPLNKKDVRDLKLLKNMILADARYPVFVPDGTSYTDAVNEQTERVWNSENFEDCTELASRIRDHSKKIDSDSNHPSSLEAYQMGDDGYFSFRVGGHLPPRITYRVSTIQKSHCQTSLDDIRALFPSSRYPLICHYWERSWIYEDGETRTRCLARPKSG